MRNNDQAPNISGMLTFSRVVEAGSFTAAAKQLGVSKASVSREVAALEAHLGAQLLRRTTRRMSLTEVGDVFYSHCVRVAEEAQAAELSVFALQAAPHGLLRVAAPMSFGHLELSRRFPRFLERYPDLRVELELTDRVIDLVHERIDLSIRIGRPRSGSYVLRRLCPVRGLMVGSPDYFERRGKPERPGDLTQHNCLDFRGTGREWRFAGGERVVVHGNLSADNGDAVRGAALEGLGIAYLPSFIVAEDVRAGRLIPILSDATVRVSALYAIYPESRQISPKVRALIDWLTEEFPNEPEWDANTPVEGYAPHAR